MRILRCRHKENGCIDVTSSSREGERVLAFDSKRKKKQRIHPTPEQTRTIGWDGLTVPI